MPRRRIWLRQGAPICECEAQSPVRSGRDLESLNVYDLIHKYGEKTHLRSALAIVKPETVIAWHRKGFRLYWTWKSRHGPPGRPTLAKRTRELIRRMSLANPLWGG